MEKWACNGWKWFENGLTKGFAAETPSRRGLRLSFSAFAIGEMSLRPRVSAAKMPNMMGATAIEKRGCSIKSRPSLWPMRILPTYFLLLDYPRK